MSVSNIIDNPRHSHLTISTQSDINWYVEKYDNHSPHNVILIPSGEGDCYQFRPLAHLLNKDYRVITFDMPGMSKTTCAKECLEDITPQKLADQVIELMDKLLITRAVYYGCSSGALTALALVAYHPRRIINAVVHEAPLVRVDALGALKGLSDEEIPAVVGELFAKSMCEDEAKWLALGKEYHARLAENYVLWVRYYLHQIESGFTKEQLTRRPVAWTLGALTPAGRFWQNVVDGFGAGIEVGLLECKHFPQVTFVNGLAKHIKEHVEKNSPYRHHD